MPATMTMATTFAPAFDQIVETTRAVLAAIPDDKLDWKPHEKSYSLGELGSHIANVPGWTAPTLQQDSLDVAPSGGEEMQQPEYKSSAEMIAALDDNAAQARAVIEDTSDETFVSNWTMLVGGEERFSMPKAAVLRVFILDHMIHHRAQLGVYLRLLDVPVPQTFGPTADFPDM